MDITAIRAEADSNTFPGRASKQCALRQLEYCPPLLGKFKAEGERARRDFAMDLAVWVLNRNAAELAAAKDIFDEVFKHTDAHWWYVRAGTTPWQMLRPELR